MAHQHIVEQLIEANKKILNISNQMENESTAQTNTQVWIDDLNDIIRKLDHIVEGLERSK